MRKGTCPILLALARATVLRGEAILGDFSSLALEIFSCSREEVKKRRSLVQIFEDQGMESMELSYLYGNYHKFLLV